MIECWIRQSKKCSNNHKKKTIFPVQKNTFLNFWRPITSTFSIILSLPVLHLFRIKKQTCPAFVVLWSARSWTTLSPPPLSPVWPCYSIVVRVFPSPLSVRDPLSSTVDGCGIAVSDNDRITYKKHQGLISTYAPLLSSPLSPIPPFSLVCSTTTPSRESTATTASASATTTSSTIVSVLSPSPPTATCRIHQLLPCPHGVPSFGLSVVMSGSVNNRDALRKEFAKHLRLINSYDVCPPSLRERPGCRLHRQRLLRGPHRCPPGSMYFRFSSTSQAELNEEGIPIPTVRPSSCPSSHRRSTSLPLPTKSSLAATEATPASFSSMVSVSLPSETLTASGTDLLLLAMP